MRLDLLTRLTRGWALLASVYGATRLQQSTENNRMKPNIRREAKTCSNVLLPLVCLGLVLASWLDRAAEGPGAGAGITWLSLTQSSPPSKIAELRRDILTFLEPLRRRLFGDPDVVLATAYFVSISPARAGQNLFPSATSTNVDGTTACVLSATQISQLRQRIQNTEGANQFAAPRVTAFEGVRSTLSVSRTVQIGGTNAPYGPTLDLVHHVNGTYLHMRLIADVTEAVTNVLRATADAPATESVNLRTMFQSALEARVTNGGGVAVWNRLSGKGDKTYLIMVCPTIQTNFAAPPPARKPGSPPQ